MKRTIISLMMIAVIALSFAKAQSVEINELQVKATFDMPASKVPDFSKCVALSITDFGAIRGIRKKHHRLLQRQLIKQIV
jgi:hypothetical protein